MKKNGKGRKVFNLISALVLSCLLLSGVAFAETTMDDGIGEDGKRAVTYTKTENLVDDNGVAFEKKTVVVFKDNGDGTTSISEETFINGVSTSSPDTIIINKPLDYALASPSLTLDDEGFPDFRSLIFDLEQSVDDLKAGSAV